MFVGRPSRAPRDDSAPIGVAVNRAIDADRREPILGRHRMLAVAAEPLEALLRAALRTDIAATGVIAVRGVTTSIEPLDPFPVRILAVKTHPATAFTTLKARIP